MEYLETKTRDISSLTPSILIDSIDSLSIVSL